MKRLFLLLSLSAVIASCENEEPKNDCGCVYAVYQNPATLKYKSFKDEPVSCQTGTPVPIESVKGNYYFVECLNAPKY